ncbi:MAG: hypothetical protein JW909_03570 [Planctomycetes bacterium]|nr:hypothetical protein [Planctomycetota bacterium]
MKQMTGRERVDAVLNRRPVDHCPFFEAIWGDTIRRWQGEGRMPEGASAWEHFNMDIVECWAFNLVADLDFQEEIIDETDEWKLVLNGNGARLKWWKAKSGTPEHVDFTVKDRAGWEEHARSLLVPDRRRINFEAYRNAKTVAAGKNRFFTWSGVNVFECMHPLCGHEYMLMGMALDPDWVRDMCDVYSDLTVSLWEMLFDEEGMPDGIFFYEDMGFKGKPFMSPAMYREIIQPAHVKTISWAHDHGLKVIMHSCGMVEELLPGMVEAGIDMLQAMEVKAGMDMVRMNRQYGDRIGFFGNIDIREIASNDRARVDAELEKKILPLMESKTPYILSSDHSTPPDVDYDTFIYFRDRGLELARYT